jgi:hypothetical protein
MNFFSKCFRFVYGLILFFRYRRTLDIQNALAGKRVAIVGAANSAFNTGLGAHIDNFDVVIRINKAPLLLKEGKWMNDIGSKTDILFHSFFENEKSGGGSLDMEMFDALGIRQVLNPVAEYSGYRVTFNFYKKYLLRRTTYALPESAYSRIQHKLGTFRPTIGFCALHSVMETQFSELYITGFTFFRTAFGEGYRNDMKEAHQVQKYIKDAGMHDPDLEYDIFVEMLKVHHGKNIILDNTLKRIVSADLENG